MNAKRLLRLADLLDTVPAKRFDMGLWADSGFEEAKCATAACACGWATTIPSFRRAGLRLVADSGFGCELVFGELIEDDAARAFFGIDAEGVRLLFYPESYRSENPRPKTVANRIREYVAEATR